MRCSRRPTSPTCWWRCDVPFREAHGIVAGLVRTAVDSDRTLSQLTPDELAAHSVPLAEHSEQYYDALGRRLLAGVEDLRGRHRARARVREQIEAARACAPRRMP